MPNAKILSEKQAIVASLTEKFQNAAAGVIVDYRGITVAEDTELRAKMRENGVEYFVVKNTLAWTNCATSWRAPLPSPSARETLWPRPRWWLSSPRSWPPRRSS